MTRVELQRLADRIELLAAPTERLVAAGQIRPQRRVPWIGAGRPGEHGLRLFGRAPIEHAHAQFVQHRGMIRGPLRHACQQAVGFGQASGRRLGTRHLDDLNDRGLIERGGGGGIQGGILGSSGADNCTLAASPADRHTSRSPGQPLWRQAFPLILY